jgi:two-component system, LytTR family, sensor kinase
MKISKEKILQIRYLTWITSLTICTIIGLLLSIQFYIKYKTFHSEPTPFFKMMAYVMPDWLMWSVLMPLILRLSEHFRIEKGRWKVSISLHLLFSVVLSLIEVTASSGVVWLIFPPEQPSLEQFIQSVEYTALSYFHWNVMIYWTVVALSYLIDYYKRFHETESKTFKLQSELTEAELRALKMQLHPHFLFNTLNTISYYIYEDVDLANRMVTDLSDLLRKILDQSGTPEVTLKQELDLLDKYLDIEKVRFQDRLTIEIDIDPAVLDSLVPNLILQPLVENAIRHGIAPHATPGRIRIKTVKPNGHLLITIADNGSGMPRSKPAGSREGIGLANTRARLQHHYGDEASMRLYNADTGGLVVELKIPYHVGGK